QVAFEELARGRPVLCTHPGPPAALSAVYAPLEVGLGAPRLALGVLEPVLPATLDTPFGRMPVRAFFAAVAGLVLLVGVFLSLVVTSRITKPIEELERKA